MRKIFSTLALVAMAFAVVACGGEKRVPASKNITYGDENKIDSLSYCFGFTCGYQTPEQMPGVPFKWDKLVEGLEDALYGGEESEKKHEKAYENLSDFFNNKYYTRMQEEYSKIMADTTFDQSKVEEHMKNLNIFENDEERLSVSYDYGFDMGYNLEKSRLPFQIYWLKKGINDGLSKDASELKADQAQDYMRRVYTEIIPTQNKARSEKWLAEVEKDTKGAQKTESGIVYLIEREGDPNIKPTAEDSVVAHYEGTLYDGTKFDSSYDRGEPATFPLNRVIAGWTEGLQLIGKGGKITLWIPSELAYGEQNMSVIQPNEALKFVVELEDVIKAEPVEESAE